MVLDFGLLDSGLFPQSAAQGEGIGADQNAAVVWTDVGQGTSKIIEADTTGGASGETGNYAKIAEVSIGAGTVNSYVVIGILHESKSMHDSGVSAAGAWMDIRAGVSGSVVSKQILNMDAIATSNNSSHVWSGYIQYYYEPSAVEMATGFDIEIYGKGQSAGASHSYCNCKQLHISGE